MVCEIVLFYPLTERETEDKRNGLAFTSLHPCYLLDTEGEMQSPQSILLSASVQKRVRCFQECVASELRGTRSPDVWLEG